MPEQTQTSEEVFVVRMWRAGRSQPLDGWRGRVEHVSSGQRRFFSSLVDLCEFISACEKTLDGA